MMPHHEKAFELLIPGDEASRREGMRYLARTDLYFLLVAILGRKDCAHPWLAQRIKEVQDNPDDHLDLWARAHYKSTIITFAKTIQDILASHGDGAIHDREMTFGIFSHTRPIAKSFLRQIKREFDTNDKLKYLFDDILWANPRKEAAKWSEDGGLVVKRQGNPKEATIEAWGLVDGQPTGKHFSVLIYDDIVTRESVTTPEQIEKTTEALALSYNLGDSHKLIRRFIGTRYHFNDTYKTIIDRQTVTPRIYAATEDGTVGGTPVFLSRESIEQKRRDMGPYIFNSQMLQNPVADGKQGFKREWLCYYHDTFQRGNANFYLLVDPANSKKKSSDYTAMFVLALNSDDNYYIVDMIRDRLSLRERVDMVMTLHRKWRPMGVGYEQYGMQADLGYLQEIQNKQNYRFTVTPLGGSMAKEDRIKRLVPIFENGRMYFPMTMHKTNYEGKTIDLVESFINDEYLAFPVSVHDDMLDALARITDPELQVIWPEPDYQDAYAKKGRYQSTPKHNGAMTI